MTDRLEEIAAGLIDGGIDYPTFADVEWLIAEVRALRQRHAEACAVLESCGTFTTDPEHPDLVWVNLRVDSGVWAAWLASDAKRGLT